MPAPVRSSSAEAVARRCAGRVHVSRVVRNARTSRLSEVHCSDDERVRVPGRRSWEDVAVVCWGVYLRTRLSPVLAIPDAGTGWSEEVT